MAALNPKNPVLLRNATRPVAEIVKRLADGAATWKAGQLLYQKNDGLIYTCASDATTIQFLAVQDLDSAIGADTTYKRMMVINQDDILEMNELDGAVTEANVGTFFGLDVSSNLCTVDVAEVTSEAFVMMAPTWREEEFVNKSADTLARLLVKVKPAVLEAEAA